MIQKIIDQTLVERIDQAIQSNQSFVVVAHENPDGDAIGSTLGMYHYLKALGKSQVKVMIPTDIPSNLMWLPGAEDILVYTRQKRQADEYIRTCDVLMFLDLNEMHRTGVMAPALEKSSAFKILIDHHEFPSPFAHLVVSHPEICATSELVFRLICRSGRLDLLTKEGAECIYTGMMTDTGCFAYNSNQPDVYIIIHHLLGCGVDKDQIYRNVFYAHSLDRMRMMGYALYRAMEILPEYQTAVMVMNKKTLDSFNTQPGDTDSFVNLPLSILGIRLSVFLKEDGVVRVSFRSVGDVPVNRLASELFGGGGHKNAAGARFNGTLLQAKRKIIAALPAFFASIDNKA